MTVSVPDSRSYAHAKCGEKTDVDGGDFKNVATPVPGVHHTVCAACGRAFPIEEFSWEDSGESIVSYYERHRARLPGTTKLLCSRGVGFLIWFLGAVAGVGIGILCGQWLGLWAGIGIGFISVIAGFIAALLIWDRISDSLIQSALGVPDVRCLT